MAAERRAADAIVAALLALCVSPAWACRCAPQTLAEYFQRAGVVMQVRVEQVEIMGNGVGDGDGHAHRRAQFTRLHILLYTAILFAVSLLPLGIGMSGWIYGLIALPLGLLYFVKTWQLYRRPSRELPGWLFTYSIVYLMVIFAALLLDHYL